MSGLAFGEENFIHLHTSSDVRIQNSLVPPWVLAGEWSLYHSASWNTVAASTSTGSRSNLDLEIKPRLSVGQ